MSEARRRVRFQFYREGGVEIDFARLKTADGLGLTRAAAPDKIELALRQAVEMKDGGVTRVAEAIGVEGTYDRNLDSSLDVVYEEHCPIHDIWWGLNAPKKQRKCWMCQDDELKAKDDERERKKRDSNK